MAIKIQWRVKEFLEQNAISAYRLREESGVGNETIYSVIKAARATGVRFDTLSKVLEACEKLLGREVQLEELFEISRDV